MKKLSVCSFIITVCLILLGSCASGGGEATINDSLPDENVAVIHWYSGGVKIIEFNGIAVEWGKILGSEVITIPGGRTTFILNGTTGSANMGFTTYNNIPFTYNFENGKEYRLQISQYLILVFEGSKISRKNLLAQFNMINGQTELER